MLIAEMMCSHRRSQEYLLEAEPKRGRPQKRDAKGVVGKGIGWGVPLPNRLGVWRSIVSSLSEVWGRAQTENEFWVYCKLEKHI